MTAPIIPGAEPFSRSGGRSGVLFLHGFTGNPRALRWLAEDVADAGYTVDLPLLPGHGTAVEDLMATAWPDWWGAADASYATMAAACDSVAVVGLSMGGTIACWLAERHPEISGLAVVNPFIDPPAESYRDMLRGLIDAGTDVAPGVGSDIAKEGESELAYPGTPIAAALSFFEGIDDTAAHLPRISCPVLLLSSRNDHVVPSSSGDVLCAGVTGPIERVWLEKSYHVATLDYDAEEIARRVLGFVGEVLA